MDMGKSKTFSELKKLSKNGVACDQCNLGVAYGVGDGVTKDMKKAVKWYRKAAERGDSIAQILLGDCYFLGEGMEENKEEAIRWYQKAIENEYRLAFLKLKILSLPTDVQKRGIRLLRWYEYITVLGIEKALKYFEKDNANEELDDREIVEASLKGNEGAHCILGLQQLFSIAQSENIKDVVRWYRSAAEQGDSCAQYVMGNFYDLGIGVMRNPVTAVEWFRKSALQGNTGAQCILGAIYLSGRGVAKSKSEAIKWYALAAEQGDEKAVRILQQLAKDKQ